VSVNIGVTKHWITKIDGEEPCDTTTIVAELEVSEAEARKLLGLGESLGASPAIVQSPDAPSPPNLGDALKVVVATIERDVIHHPDNADRVTAAAFLREWLNVTTVR